MAMQHPQPMLAMLPVQPQQQPAVMERLQIYCPLSISHLHLVIIWLASRHCVPHHTRPCLPSSCSSHLPWRSLLFHSLLCGPWCCLHSIHLSHGQIRPLHHSLQQPNATPFPTELHMPHLQEVPLSEAEIPPFVPQIAPTSQQIRHMSVFPPFQIPHFVNSHPVPVVSASPVPLVSAASVPVVPASPVTVMSASPVPVVSAYPVPLVSAAPVLVVSEPYTDGIVSRYISSYNLQLRRDWALVRFWGFSGSIGSIGI